jgi:hypothetical protein
MGLFNGLARNANAKERIALQVGLTGYTSGKLKLSLQLDIVLLDAV